MSKNIGDIATLDGDIIKAENQMMIEIRVIMPLDKIYKPINEMEV